VCISFEATSLRQAVEAAGVLRQVIPSGVRVRPAQHSRLGPYEWTIVVTTGPLDAGRIATLGEEMRWVARRRNGIRFIGWLWFSGSSRPFPAAERLPTAPATLGVLIVDGSAPYRQAARRLLELDGHRVVGEADGAASGLVAFDRLKPDAVVLDVRLPDGCGLDLCELLTGEPDAPAVLLVSSYGAADAALARAHGARDFIPKENLADVDLRAICASV
jgi:CheY-like chemotaxis protein